MDGEGRIPSHPAVLVPESLFNLRKSLLGTEASRAEGFLGSSPGVPGASPNLPPPIETRLLKAMPYEVQWS